MFPASYFSEDDCRRFVIRDLSHSQAGGGRKEAEPIRGLWSGGFNLDQGGECDEERRRLGEKDR